jgi:hypothetical protein
VGPYKIYARGSKLDLSPQGVLWEPFFHNRPKNDPQDLKNGLERRVPRFCTSCDKKQPLNQKKMRKLWQFYYSDGPKFLILGVDFRSKNLYHDSIFCMGSFQKTTVALVSHNSPLWSAQNTFSWTWYDAILSTSQHLESPKYFKLLFPWAKPTAHHTNLK